MIDRCSFRVLTFSVLLLAASCGKDDDLKPPKCRLDRIAQSSGGFMLRDSIVYGTDKRIAAIYTGGTLTYQRIFTYSGSDVIVVKSYPAGVVTRDSITLNASGLMTNYRSFPAGTGSWENTAYTYDDSGRIAKQTETNSGNGASNVITFSVSAGNVVTSSDGFSYAYYTDQAQQTADWIEVVQLLNEGSVAIRNRNLVRSRTAANGHAVTCSYTYNSNGVVSTLTVASTGAAPLLFDFAYTCD